MQMRTNVRLTLAVAAVVLGACSSSSTSSTADSTTTVAGADAAATTTTAAPSAAPELVQSVAAHLGGVHKMQGVTVEQDADGTIVISTQTEAGNTGDGVLTCNNAMMVAGNVDLVVQAADASVLAHRDKGGDCTAGA